MSTVADQIINHMSRLGEAGEAPETAREIAESLHANPATVTTALKRLEYLGKVRKMGVAFSGARAWTITENGA